jgi:hypothetical protein
MSRDNLPSLHDHVLVSYEVNCEAREIRLRTRSATEAGNQLREINFTGVEGYHFENDAFGNIIFALEIISIDQLISGYSSQIAESYRVAGAPGPWAADLSTAAQKLTRQGLQGFVLSSSYGLSGWVLAMEGRMADRSQSEHPLKLNIPIE